MENSDVIGKLVQLTDTEQDVTIWAEAYLQVLKQTGWEYRNKINQPLNIYATNGRTMWNDNNKHALASLQLNEAQFL
jgi:hypothetical protein